MPEAATFISALRTGKVDWTGVYKGSRIKSIDQAVSLARTNPEIVLTKVWYRSDNAYGFSLTKPPFDDLRVRQAMQMALDHETINNTYYKGYGNWEPQGRLASDFTGWTTPFEEWPEEVKKYYTYDPEGAEALLDAAGLPRGADGIRFKTVLNSNEVKDISYQELVSGYWREIGIQVEIRRVAYAEMQAMQKSGLFEGFWDGAAARRWDPLSTYSNLYSKSGVETWTGIADPVYDALYEAAEAAETGSEEQKRLCREMDLRQAEMHWFIWGTESPMFNANQPWVKGYNGEMHLGVTEFNWIYVYMWIDHELKASMGF